MNDSILSHISLNQSSFPSRDFVHAAEPHQPAQYPSSTDLHPAAQAQTSRVTQKFHCLATMTRKRKHKQQITYGKRQRGKPQHSPTLSSDGIEMFFPNSDSVDLEQKPPPQPPRPISQKAATMPAEPSEEDVQTFMAIAEGVGRSDAVRYLKVRLTIV